MTFNKSKGSPIGTGEHSSKKGSENRNQAAAFYQTINFENTAMTLYPTNKPLESRRS